MKLPWYALVSLLLLACSRDPSAAATSVSSTASANLPASAPTTPTPSGERSESDDEVKPVYPLTTDPPDPLAARLCDALHALPAKRKGQCCSEAPGFHLAAECTRTLSFALRTKAVTLQESDVNACIDAMQKDLTGCDWVLPLSPPPPPACEGIVRGSLNEGARCRSSLECTEGLHCGGAGPTDMGQCERPKKQGACSTAVDSLAAHTRQTRSEDAHPACTGYCARRQCADTVPLGGDCNSHLQCGKDRHCIQGKCSDAALPQAGQPCAQNLCAQGTHCVKGYCVAPKPDGDPCEQDAECRAACVKQPAATKKTCSKKCWAFDPPKNAKP